MRIRVQVVIETGEGGSLTTEVAAIERSELRTETFGLTLDEAKHLLAATQQVLIERQSEEFVSSVSCCRHCGQARSRKGHHDLRIRTLFGNFLLTSPRLRSCRCQAGVQKSESPLAAVFAGVHAVPELLYLEAKWASFAPYAKVAQLLRDVLPVSKTENAVTIRHHVHRVAQRAENELGDERWAFVEGAQRDWDQLPRPPAPLTVGLDGGYVHSCEQTSRQDGWFEIIAGKSRSEESGDRCFAFVSTYDDKPKRRLFEVLKGQGLVMNQQVTFLTDGGDTVRELPLFLCPESEHYLDWFHITMRITVLAQQAKGLGLKNKELLEKELLKPLERVKWFLWHGNVERALDALEDVEWVVHDNEGHELEKKKLAKSVEEFRTYLEKNAPWIPNYGERHRYGEAISTAFVESTVNQVVSKRMVKKQQMRWSRKGAHLLLQIRTKVLNDEFSDCFRRWYPQFRASQEQAC